MSVSGMGLYYRALDPKLIEHKARHAKEHKLSHVALPTAWQQPKNGKIVTTGTKLETLCAYAEAFIARGIEVRLWGYPWCGEEEAFLDRFRAAVDRVPAIAGFIPDPELGSKWRTKTGENSSHTMRGGEAIAGEPGALNKAMATKHADYIMGGLAALTTVENGRGVRWRDIVVTSYGRPRFHKNFPWEAWLQFSWEGNRPTGSPQLYTSTVDELNAGIDEWLALGPVEFCPSFATFGARSGAQLFSQLCAFVEADEHVHGLLGWSEPQTSPDEWLQLARFADWLEQGRCAL